VCGNLSANLTIPISHPRYGADWSAIIEQTFAPRRTSLGNKISRRSGGTH
jgi:hypothetical protein